MDFFLALVLMVGAYYIIELILKHRERMAQLQNPQTHLQNEDDEDDDDE